MTQRLHIIVSTEQHAAMTRESKLTGAPIAELVRRAIDEYLAKRAEPKPRKRT